MLRPGQGGVSTTRLRTPAVLLGALVSLTAFGFPAAAQTSRATTCTLINHNLTIDPQHNDVDITRNGSTMVANGIPCGSLTDIDTVHINLGNSSQLTIDQTQGLFAPGFTNEAGTSDEIEFAVTNVPTVGVVLVSGPGPDSFKAGKRT